MIKHRNELPASELDDALAAVERDPLGQMLFAAGQQTQPRPEFVARLRDRLQQRTKAAPPPARRVPGRPRWRPVALTGAALALCVVLGGLFWLAQPAPVNAAQVLARASAPPAVQSLHGVLAGQHRESAGAALTDGQFEVWYQAPAHTRFVETEPGGTRWEVSDGTSTWSYTSGAREVQIGDAEPAQSSLFAASSLSQVVQATNHGQYDATLMPAATIGGRPAYVLDLTARPGAGVVTPHARLWVDQQTYLPLRQDDWDEAGNLLATVAWRTLELNPALDPTVFVFVPPAGVPVVDKRTPGGAAAQDEQWQQADRQAGFAVFRPAAYPLTITQASVEYSPATRQVIARTTLQPAESGPANLILREGRPADLPLPGPGTPVALGNVSGEYQVGGGWASLSLEQDGTRILLQTPPSASAQALLIKTALSLAPINIH